MYAANTLQNFSMENENISVNGMFTGLFRDSVYGTCLRVKRHVFATHQELSIMRRCAEMLQEGTSRIIHVIAARNRRKTDFIVNTLMHLGVSCGQIKVSAVGPALDGPQDVWLFVTEQG